MDPQQQQYTIFAIVAAVVIIVVTFVFLNQKKPKSTKSEVKSTKKVSPAAPVPTPSSAAASASEAEGTASGTEAAKKKRKKRSKAKAATKGQVIAPVGQMDDAPESDEEEDATPPKVETPTVVKEAPKPKKTLEEKVVEELLKMDDKKNKDKKNKDNKKGNGKKSPVVVKMEDNTEADESDEGEDAIFLTGKAAAAAADGWAVVEKKGGKQPKKPDAVTPLSSSPVPVVEQVTVSTASASAEETAASPVVEEVPEEVSEEEEEDKTPAAPPVPVIEKVTQELTVEAKRLGLLIGVKGATRIAIQSATDTNIQMPKTEKDSTGDVTISVTGEEAGVAKAIVAMKELLSKGYCLLLADPDFRESDVTVHPRFLPDIIGKNGSVIKALGQHTGVKITVPSVTKAPGPDGKVSKVKIGLAGPKEKVALCRNLIKEITRFYHTEVTHPNVIHEEMTIDAKYYNFIIGAKGSEIKHIQNSYKVSVHIPDADSVNTNVLIVGEAAGVANAKRHVEKLIDKVDERNNPKPAEPTEEEAEAVASSSEAESPTTGPTTAATQDGEESWMKELVPPSGDAFPATISAPIGLTKSENGKPAWNTLAAGKTW